MQPLKQVIKDQFALLSFRSFKPNLAGYANWYLGFGLVTAWLAGMGRYWDNPRAELWQTLGVGSVIYCFFLSAVIYWLIAPMKPKNWSYRNILIFISMTSLPAILYAIPVERFTQLSTAELLNLIFLAVVALWRVILLVLYLKRSARLTGLQIVVATLLPIVVIINALSILNLEHVVFNIMAGLRPEERTGNDASYYIVVYITVLSYTVLPFLLAGYGWFIYKARRRKD